MTWRIIPRVEWGARHPDGFSDAPLPAAECWLHHSVTIAPDLIPPWDDDYAAIRLLEQIGQQRFGGGISYTWLITPSGLIFQGHSVHRQGAHTGGRNDVARAICLVGNYQTQRPTGDQIRSAGWLLQHAKAKGWLRDGQLRGGHRDVLSMTGSSIATSCPGDYAYAAIPEINRLAAGPSLITAQEDDMPTADEIARALLDAPIKREGGRTGNTSLRATVAWLDANLDALKAAGLTREELREELADAAVDVTITVPQRTPEDTPSPTRSEQS